MKNAFEPPKTVKELVERLHKPSSAMERRILSHLASVMLDRFASSSSTSMDASRVLTDPHKITIF
ncbi:hypothetical protein [Legionella birminghamensis]|uniref:hypothetical protein n=1 Tax=Legionella birminghamensis TaxID=28083 RepID=UPI00073186D9|nr:hypothetical protein [Legionella birminghamensis]